MESHKRPQIVCLIRGNITFTRILQTLQQLVASSAAVVLLFLEPAAHAVQGWDAEDQDWREKLNRLPLTVCGDTPSCALSDVIIGIDQKQMAEIIRNADIVVPL